jgi:hypothetical protein
VSEAARWRCEVSKVEGFRVVHRIEKFNHACNGPAVKAGRLLIGFIRDTVGSDGLRNRRKRMIINACTEVLVCFGFVDDFITPERCVERR